ncbi:MAG: MerR family transcriptional regulator [Micrococcales bacterium]|nr:MerR family transcriptional regulator [Micrococcales bacterium]OJX66805.1 MAG: MerR family transcriptional regulator [Micrococcales bacterium 72-143]
MTTEALIAQLLTTPEAPSAATIDALHQLLDDSTIEESDPPLGVREAAALVKLSPHTLRYYENEGLVRPARNGSGYREYAAGDLRRLVFLTRMRVSGMTMQDLKRYIRLVEQGDTTIAERRRIMLDQRDRITRQLRELTLALEATEYKIRSYGGPDLSSRPGQAD